VLVSAEPSGPEQLQC